VTGVNGNGATVIKTGNRYGQQGGGLLSSGSDNESNRSGKGFIDGGNGGDKHGGLGGFGGGASGDGSIGGGGGGFSGDAGAIADNTAGGGGSYSITGKYDYISTNNDNGFVIITMLPGQKIAAEKNAAAAEKAEADARGITVEALRADKIAQKEAENVKAKQAAAQKEAEKAKQAAQAARQASLFTRNRFFTNYK